MPKTIRNYLPEQPDLLNPLEPRDYRGLVLEIARAEIGSTDPTPYFREAAPAFDGTAGVSWCQIGALFCLRRAGLTDWVHDIGGGWLGRLPLTDDPQPADLEVLERSKSGALVWHTCLFERRHPDGSLSSIDFNVGGGTVAEKTRRPEWYRPRPQFRSIQPLIDAALIRDHGPADPPV
jgi:hypothetical protein